MKQERLWVHPSFKRRLKREAVERDTSILNLTKELGEETYDFLRSIKNEKKGFRFKI